MDKDSKIYVAGHNGLVGSAICRQLESQGYKNIIKRSHLELDLTRQIDVENFFKQEKPEYVFLAAAKVGGIKANATYPADFIMDNIKIEFNIIDSAFKNEVKKLLFLGSTCIYPKNCPQPIKEEYLLTSELEKTNEAYALAKIAGLKACSYYKKQYGANFISAMPCNLYGIGDNFDLENSHVLPALIRKFHEAKIKNLDTVEVWGTGKPLREFLFSDDLGKACIFLMNNYNGNEHINVGFGTDLSIKELAEIIKEIVGFKGQIVFDVSKPDGTFKKLTDITKIKNLGWSPKTNLKDGIQIVYKWFLKNKEIRK